MGILQALAGVGGSLQVNASNATKNNSGFIGCGHPGSTNTPGTAVQGGIGTNTFLWTRVSGTPTYGPWKCSDVTAQNPTWRAPGPVCDNADSATEIWKVVATDNANGKIGDTQINVTILWTDLR
jgi:hypothetical protein